MLTKVIVNILRYLILVVLQVLLLNNIQLSGYINPYIYVLFILLLPIESPGWVVLIASFAIGLSVDVFSSTLGMHAAACAFIGFIRPFLLKRLAPREGYETETSLDLSDMGLSWFALYACIMVIIHHVVLFYTEVFRADEFFTTLLRALTSSVVSVGLIILSQYLFFRAKIKK